MKYMICYNHDEHGSDTLDVDYPSYEAAQADIVAIRKNPNYGGWVDWLAEASLWVVDENGNLM